MSVYDYEDAPPPPPRHQAKVVKDKSLKDDVLYRVEYYIPRSNRWNASCFVFTSIRNATAHKSILTKRDKSHGIKHEYRIVKLTTKKEVVG